MTQEELEDQLDFEEAVFGAFSACVLAAIVVMVTMSWLYPIQLPHVPAPWEIMKIVPQTRCFPEGTLGVGFPCIDKLMDSVIAT